MRKFSCYVNKLSFISFILWLAIQLTGCGDSFPTISPDSEGPQDSFIVHGSLKVSNFPTVSTRGQMGLSPGQGLKLTLLEFDRATDEVGNPNTINSFITNVYHAEIKSTQGNEVTFEVELKASSNPKVIHYVLSDSYVSATFGSEASILPVLSIGEGEEAYWGKVEFPDGYASEDSDGKVTQIDELDEKFKNVPLLRSFAQISVTENLDDFELLGFELVNVPTTGTIAPWKRSDLSIPDLITERPDQSKSFYSYVTDDLKYPGIMPSGVVFRNTEVEARNWNGMSIYGKTDSRFMYEHPYEQTRRTYIIIYGSFRHNETENWTPGFYKVDIGTTIEKNTEHEDGTSIKELEFDNYNIIRNINYNVVIKEVKAPGANTVSEAISRAAFNNVVASTDLSTLPSMSDGYNLLMVNDLNHVIVHDDEKIEFLYRYIPDIYANQTKVEDNSIPRTVGLRPGAVIKSVGQPAEITDEYGAKWMKYVITCNNPTDETQTQDFSVVDANGLGRTVHLILRKPWQYVPIATNEGPISATVAPGHEDSYQGPPQIISPDAGKELTVYFNLPDGLPQSMFPLEFQLESKNQGIENNKIGTLVVTSGPSLFPDKENQITISYIKTLSYDEYLYNYVSGDTSNDVDISSPNLNHTVRCRFLTITSVNDTNAEIMIHNPYFTPNASVSFRREHTE